jgi:hypothetical protein
MYRKTSQILDGLVSFIHNFLFKMTQPISINVARTYSVEVNSEKSCKCLTNFFFLAEIIAFFDKTCT